MMTVSDLLDRLGRQNITDRYGHGVQVLSRASTENVMPPGWYPDIRDMCAEAGIPCPEYLFRWARHRRGAPNTGRRRIAACADCTTPDAAAAGQRADLVNGSGEAA